MIGDDWPVTEEQQFQIHDALGLIEHDIAGASAKSCLYLIDSICPLLEPDDIVFMMCPVLIVFGDPPLSSPSSFDSAGRRETALDHRKQKYGLLVLAQDRLIATWSTGLTSRRHTEQIPLAEIADARWVGMTDVDTIGLEVEASRNHLFLQPRDLTYEKWTLAALPAAISGDLIFLEQLRRSSITLDPNLDDITTKIESDFPTVREVVASWIREHRTVIEPPALSRARSLLRVASLHPVCDRPVTGLTRNDRLNLKEHTWSDPSDFDDFVGLLKEARNSWRTTPADRSIPANKRGMPSWLVEIESLHQRSERVPAHAAPKKLQAEVGVRSVARELKSTPDASPIPESPAATSSIVASPDGIETDAPVQILSATSTFLTPTWTTFGEATVNAVPISTPPEPSWFAEVAAVERQHAQRRPKNRPQTILRVGVLCLIAALIGLSAAAIRWSNRSTAPAEPAMLAAAAPPSYQSPMPSVGSTNPVTPEASQVPASDVSFSTEEAVSSACPTDQGEECPGDDRSAIDLAQRLASAFASGDWDTVRQLELAKSNYDDATFEEGWGKLRRLDAVPVQVLSETETGQLLRLALVGHELLSGQEITTAFCVTWRVDSAQNRVEQTGLDTVVLYSIEEPVAGWVDYQTLTAGERANCG